MNCVMDLIKFHGTTIWEPQDDRNTAYIQISVIMRCAMKGLYCECNFKLAG